MARHVWSVLCERALIDAVTESVSLMDVTEGLEIEGALDGPTAQVHVHLALVSFWTREAEGEPEIATARFKVVGPSKAMLDESRTIKVDLSEEPRAVTVASIETLTVSTAGIYEFEVEQRQAGKEWRRCAAVPLPVSIVEGSQADKIGARAD